MGPLMSRRTVVLGVVASVGVLGGAVGACAKHAPEGAAETSSVVVPPPAAAGSQGAPAVVEPVRVTVSTKGFSPNKVTVDKGTPLSLAFMRTTDETCAKEVVFPELNLRKDLPLNEPVVIEVPTTESRTLTFQCGMAMYKSAVVVR